MIVSAVYTSIVKWYTTIHFLSPLLTVGYCVCEGSYLSIQYYGEERYLLVKHISSLELSDTIQPSNTLSSIKEDLFQKFSNLSLSPDSPPLNESMQTEQDDGGFSGSASESRSSVQVYKVTVKTKITVQRKDSSSHSAMSKVDQYTLHDYFLGIGFLILCYEFTVCLLQ